MKKGIPSVAGTVFWDRLREQTESVSQLRGCRGFSGDRSSTAADHVMQKTGAPSPSWGYLKIGSQRKE